LKTIRTTAIALAACGALLAGYVATPPGFASAAPATELVMKSPIRKPRNKGCTAKRTLELKRFPNKTSTTVGLIVAGTALRVRGKVGGWTYVNGGGSSGWTKGGVGCKG
jgi:hypothetical protein